MILPLYHTNSMLSDISMEEENYINLICLLGSLKKLFQYFNVIQYVLSIFSCFHLGQVRSGMLYEL